MVLGSCHDRCPQQPYNTLRYRRSVTRCPTLPYRIVIHPVPTQDLPPERVHDVVGSSGKIEAWVPRCRLARSTRATAASRRSMRAPSMFLVLPPRTWQSSSSLCCSRHRHRTMTRSKAVHKKQSYGPEITDAHQRDGLGDQRHDAAGGCGSSRRGVA